MKNATEETLRNIVNAHFYGNTEIAKIEVRKLNKVDTLRLISKWNVVTGDDTETTLQIIGKVITMLN